MRASRFPRNQKGAVLIVAMIILMVMTLLTLSGVRNVSIEERMTSNSYDRSLGFQAAEAALRLGESVAQTQANAVPPNKDFDSLGVYVDGDISCGNSICVNGLCSQPDKDCTERWLDTAFTGWVNAASLGLTALAATPQYIVEFLGGDFPCNAESPDTGAQDCNRYRITVRSHNGSSERSMVMLQSIYATE